MCELVWGELGTFVKKGRKAGSEKTPPLLYPLISTKKKSFCARTWYDRGWGMYFDVLM